MNACTIIAANYLAHARVLAESFFRHHPDGTFTVLSLDDLTPLLQERDRFDVWTLDQIGIEREELARMRMLYDVRELSTAVKPFLLRTLIEAHDHATYLDPDIQVFRSLDFIADLAREHALVLTPHSTRPFPRDGRMPAETDIMIAGMYNLGFCSVGRDGRPFLDWWCERLARDCVAQPERGLFVDQKWVDWAPGMFPHYILKDTSVNVAYWNVFNREFTAEGDGYEVDEIPLTFFHFSGFDPEHPERLSKHQNRIDVTAHPALKRICRSYADAMLDAGFRGVRGIPCALELLPDGTRIDEHMRRVYRHALLRAEAGGGSTPIAPNDARQAEAYLSWLGEPARRRGAGKHVSRYLAALQEGRADLRRAFPDMGRRTDVEQYLEWLRREGAAQMGVPERFAPTGTRFVTSELEPEHGILAADPDPVVTVAGYFKAELGVGEAGRSIVTGLGAAGVPYVTRTYTETLSRQNHEFAGVEATPDAYSDINIVCVNADALPGFVVDAGPEFFRDRYTIGLWFWEVGTFPEVMHESFSYVDEVWVSSDFVREVVQRETVKPVRVVPMALTNPAAAPLDRATLGIPPGFMFLFVFDLLSIVERKNPHGLIDAYVHAFATEDGACLVLKTINGDRQPTALASLRDAAAQRDDIVIIDGYLPADQKNGLMSGCDCYVSLHRSEGFGLTMSEAMALGRPVIATGYSGNLAFMDTENSYLVDYELDTVPEGCAPYPVGAEWATPSVSHASQLMRHVFEHQDEARERGERGRVDVADRMSAARAGEFISGRIANIREHDMRERKPITLRGPVARAESFVRVGPENSWDQRGGRAGRMFRNVLRRVLRPYTVRQREFESAVVEAHQY
jgi:glycosyltransferase involved in cell wall biosynthesis